MGARPIRCTGLRLQRIEWLLRASRYEEAIEASTRIIEKEEHLFRYAYRLRAAAYEKLGREESQADLDEFNKRNQFDAVSLSMICEPMSGPDIALRMPLIALSATRRIQSLNAELLPEVQHAMAKSLYVNDLDAEAAKLLEEALAGKRQVLPETQSHPARYGSTSSRCIRQSPRAVGPGRRFGNACIFRLPHAPRPQDTSSGSRATAWTRRVSAMWLCIFSVNKFFVRRSIGQKFKDKNRCRHRYTKIVCLPSCTIVTFC